jgi:hypothetical protein
MGKLTQESVTERALSVHRYKHAHMCACAQIDALSLTLSLSVSNVGDFLGPLQTRNPQPSTVNPSSFKPAIRKLHLST